MADIDIIIYCFVGVVCIFFTGKSISNSLTQPKIESFIYDFLSGILWLVFGAVHTLSAVDSNLLALGYIWYLLGFIFCIGFGLPHSIMAWTIRESNKEYDLV